MVVRTRFGVTFFALCVMCGLAFAQPVPGGSHIGGPPSAEDFQKALGLTSDQQVKINRLNQEFQPKIQKQFEALRPIQMQLETLAKSPNPDYKKIRTLLNQMSPKKIDIQIDTMRHSKTIESILTPDQREKLKGMMSRRG